MDHQSIIVLTAVPGYLFVFLIVLILFIDIRDLLLCKRLPAKVLRVVESPGTDGDGHPLIHRFPQIEFIDPNGNTVVDEMKHTSMTWRKPGDRFKIFYRAANNKAGYKICAPFMWPKLIVLAMLTFGAYMFLFGPHTNPGFP